MLCVWILAPRLAAAAAVRAVPVESSAFRLSPVLVVEVISLLTVGAATVSAFVLVLVIAVKAAASVARLAAAAATPSVVVFKTALMTVTVAVTAGELESVLEFLFFGRSTPAGSETESGTGFGSGSGSSPPLESFRNCARSLATDRAGILQPAFNQLDGIARQLEVGV